MIHIEPHSLLDASCFITQWPQPLASMPSNFLQLRPPLEMTTVDDAVRSAIRDMLRVHGYKPTGRGKPASEYLFKISEEDEGLKSINAAVDACNIVSLFSGLPISVVCLQKALPDFRVAIASDKSEYVFNPSGQSISLAGLPCLFDSIGPCANAVKDSQRTKTTTETTRTLSVVWGTKTLAARTQHTTNWYKKILTAQGCQVSQL
jgi:DNA/RNA-binding domain of Phe-tRNA-synthetase-like protein